jgi:hypothetical protein
MEQETRKPGTWPKTLLSTLKVWALIKSSQLSGFLASEFLPCIALGFMVSSLKFDCVVKLSHPLSGTPDQELPLAGARSHKTPNPKLKTENSKPKTGCE